MLTLVSLNRRKRKGEGRVAVGLLSASGHLKSSPKAGRLCHSIPSSEGQSAWENLIALGLDQDGLPCLTALACARSLQSKWKMAKHTATDWVLGFWSILIMVFPPAAGWSLQGAGKCSARGPALQTPTFQDTDLFVVYAPPALHFSLFILPSNCSSLLSFLTVTLSHLQAGETMSLYRLRT